MTENNLKKRVKNRKMAVVNRWFWCGSPPNGRGKTQKQTGICGNCVQNFVRQRFLTCKSIQADVRGAGVLHLHELQGLCCVGSSWGRDMWENYHFPSLDVTCFATTCDCHEKTVLWRADLPIGRETLTSPLSYHVSNWSCVHLGPVSNILQSGFC